MGVGGIGIWQLLIVLAIVILLFGTKRLKNIGGDLGSAIKNFKSSIKNAKEDDTDKKDVAETKNKDGMIEGQISNKSKV